MEKSRTQYSAYNTSIGMISRVLSIIMGYVTRVVFTRMLSENYVGVNGLFLDLLNVLSLSELGVETAIAFSLYKPIAENDTEKQKSIMRAYHWFYRGVAVFIAVAGLCVLPFMDVLIKNKPDIEHLTYIYLLYLANTVLSYVFIYKKTLMDAHQRMYIGTIAKTGSWILQDIAQIVILIYTKDFVLFLYVYIVATILSNLYISYKANKLFPFIKEKNVAPLDKETRDEIIKNTKAMMMHKLGSVAVNGTDNLVISSFVGLVAVGCYSNYYLLIGSIRNVFNDAIDGITASVGNLGATEDKSRVMRIFKAAFFMNNWLFSVAAICLYELLNPFVELSFGEKYLFPMNVVLILCINFYMQGCTRTCQVFHNSLGLFWYDRYKAVAEAVLNLGISIVLAIKLGVVGVFLGTFISMVLTTLWVEPYVIYKYHFKENVLKYFGRMAIYFVQTAFVWGLCHAVISWCEGALAVKNVFLIMGLRLVIVAVLADLVLLLFNFWTEDFRFVMGKVQGLLKGFLSRGGAKSE